MFGRSQKEENNYQKNLKNIAKMAYYQPIASIPQPSQDFNYTLVSTQSIMQETDIATTTKTPK